MPSPGRFWEDCNNRPYTALPSPLWQVVDNILSIWQCDTITARHTLAGRKLSGLMLETFRPNGVQGEYVQRGLDGRLSVKQPDCCERSTTVAFDSGPLPTNSAFSRRVSKMLIVHVDIKVKCGCESAFMAITIENARNSLKEAGILRFDIIQREDDPERFLLMEVYSSADDQLKHRETPHFKKWRKGVMEMLAEPYTLAKFCAVFPDPEGSEWACQSAPV